MYIKIFLLTRYQKRFKKNDGALVSIYFHFYKYNFVMIRNRAKFYI